MPTDDAGNRATIHPGLVRVAGQVRCASRQICTSARLLIDLGSCVDRLHSSGIAQACCLVQLQPRFLYRDFPKSQQVFLHFLDKRYSLHLCKRRLRQNEETDCTSTGGLVALKFRCGPRYEPLSRAPISLRGHFNATGNLSSLPAAGLTCLKHLHIYVWQ